MHFSFKIQFISILKSNIFFSNNFVKYFPRIFTHFLLKNYIAWRRLLFVALHSCKDFANNIIYLLVYQLGFIELWTLFNLARHMEFDI
jgi:hypothetical protein